MRLDAAASGRWKSDATFHSRRKDVGTQPRCQPRTGTLTGRHTSRAVSGGQRARAANAVRIRDVADRDRRGRSIGRRTADLPVDRRRAGDQLPGHVHDHRWIRRTARGARGDGSRREAFRPDRRAGRSGGTALLGDHRGGMGHGLGGMRGGDEARHGRLRHGWQSRKAGSHPRPHRPGQDRGRRAEELTELVRPRHPQRGRRRWSRSRRSKSSRTRSTRERP